MLENREKAMISVVILCPAVCISDVIRKDGMYDESTTYVITSDVLFLDSMDDIQPIFVVHRTQFGRGSSNSLDVPSDDNARVASWTAGDAGSLMDTSQLG